MDVALNLLTLVTERAPLDAIMPWVRLLQVELLLKQGNRFQALSYIQDAITRCLVNDGGGVRDVLVRAMELQQQALNRP